MPEWKLIEAQSREAMVQVRDIFQEYALSLGHDLCFQGFAQELAELPGCYAKPQGGIVLAVVQGEIAGCCAFRPLCEHAAHNSACEMKRLYVRPAYRALKLGRALAQRATFDARQVGYRSMVLDTLQEMVAARALYSKLGFYEIEPYYQNPLIGARYLQLDL